MRNERFAAASFFLAVLLSAAASVWAEPSQTLDQKMTGVSPGMKRAEVLRLLGKPDSILEKKLDVEGKLLEVWRYKAENSPYLLKIRGGVVEEIGRGGELHEEAAGLNQGLL